LNSTTPESRLPTARPSGAAPAAGGNGSRDPSGHGFRLAAARPVPVLKLTLEEYRHSSGAVHFHLANEDEHRAFIVSFRTIPADSTGLPHILEHLVLCGSERYPVRDPFFNMLRRSLNTFMNAMTGGDGTYYPFATQVEKDFDNLLGIYLDAVFKPNLNPLDFNQEGYRLEPANTAGSAGASDPAPAGSATGGPGRNGWSFKGVVYNEMKGARANTDAQVGMALGRALVPDTPYRHDAGGDPAVIPALGYEDLVAFHRRHYCSGNACFATYGKLDVESLHARFAPYLEARPGGAVPAPDPQPPLAEPQVIDVPVPLEAGQDPRDVTVARLAWLWREPVDWQELLAGDLLDGLLLDHAGAPLRLALESSGLGRALGGSGYHPLGRNGSFTVALKGIDPGDYDRFPPLVLGCLEDVVRRGFEAAEVEAALHQLELARRTISGDRFPFGLELGMRVTEAWGSDLDPLTALDTGAELERLRERALAPGFLQRLVRERLLDNPHRVLLRARPDGDFNARQAEEEVARVAARVAGLDAAARAALADASRSLAERQAEPDDPTALPDLALSDIPAEQRWAEGSSPEPGLTVFETGTNGILHQVAAIPLGDLDEEDVRLLPVLASTIGALGVGARDYRARAAHLHAVCGDLSAWVDLRGEPADQGRVRGYLFLEVNGLARRGAEFAGLVAETLAGQRFDEHQRLTELLEQSLVRLQQRVTWGGSDLALQAAARGLGGRAGLSHRLDGLGRLAWLKEIDQAAGAGRLAVAELAERLAALLAKLRRRPVRVALVGDSAGDARVLADARRAWEGWERAAGSGSDEVPRIPTAAAAPVEPTAFTTATQVNYCATVFPTVPFDHPDAPALAVGSRYLTWNFLHPRIREQGGAYNGGAGCNTAAGTFSMTSYRDPRLADTFADMREGAAWLARIDDDERPVREAILDLIGSLDRPGSPAGEGRRRFVADLMGYGPEAMNAYRRRILAVRPADIRRAAEAWLAPERASRAAITSEVLLEASGLGWASRGI